MANSKKVRKEERKKERVKRYCGRTERWIIVERGKREIERERKILQFVPSSLHFLFPYHSRQLPVVVDLQKGQ